MKFIVFGEDWASHPSSTQHLFSQLAKNHEIHWVNSIGMRKPRFKLHDIKRVWGKFKQLFSKPENTVIKTPSTMQVYRLPVLPWHDNRFVRRYNRWVFSFYFKDIQSNGPLTYWLSVPTAEYFFTKKAQDTLIYYCGDDFNALAGVDPNLVSSFEKNLIKKADLIYVVSDFLNNKMPAHKTKLLPHGVSYDLFTSDVKRAPEIDVLNGPVIGFYGSINQWLDISLLTALVAERPNYQLLLVGDIVACTSELMQFKNVTHVPAVDHERLVEFSAHWDVSILPFVNNEQIRACDPLKLKEYLAAGSPIVATDFPAVTRYKSNIYIAKNQFDFINKIDQAIALDKEQLSSLKSAQQDIAKDHSWESKALLVQHDILMLNKAP
ncbi:glycosyltransferase [Pseudoalteromonas sp. 1_2015MBL_MicDiv]|uniref:glycosyltransferase n=1 Tax=Pseudoalteromonas sp. 1_2015MBL_MicDiv TaxID=1720343 RepID=UPI000BBE810A|nr:glycosyltransferase [Pseudoalteromonas sp. 1_2015MBL_MicDiv]ATG77877.1 glycosyltransferase [Pseudoalteromonas sp. 1_2015MBL_MicDiv]